MLEEVVDGTHIKRKIIGFEYTQDMRSKGRLTSSSVTFLRREERGPGRDADVVITGGVANEVSYDQDGRDTRRVKYGRTNRL